MIAGGTRGDGARYLADHLSSVEHNEVAELSASRGLVNDDDVHAALRELRAAGRTLRTNRPIHHVHADPPPDQPDWTPAQWERYWEQYEREFRLTRAPFFEVEHIKQGDHPGPRRHVHRVYLSRGDDGRVVDFSFDRPRREKVSRIVEFEFHQPFIKGAHNKAVHGTLIRDGRADVANAMERAGLLEGPRPVAKTPAERQQEGRTGVLKKDVAAAAFLSWSLSKDAPGFVNAMRQQGYGVAQGDKATIIVDRTGNIHRLPQMVASGAKAAGQNPIKATEVRDRLAGLDLPAVTGAKADAATMRALFGDVDLALEADLGRPAVDLADVALDLDLELVAPAPLSAIQENAHVERTLGLSAAGVPAEPGVTPAVPEPERTATADAGERHDQADRHQDGSPHVAAGAEAQRTEPERRDPRQAGPADAGGRRYDDGDRRHPGGPGEDRRGAGRPGPQGTAHLVGSERDLAGRGRDDAGYRNPGREDRPADRPERAAVDGRGHHRGDQAHPGAPAGQVTGRIVGVIAGSGTRAALPPVEHQEQAGGCGQSESRRRWIAGLAYGADHVPAGLIAAAEAMWTVGQPDGALKVRLRDDLGHLTDNGSAITWSAGQGVATDNETAIAAMLDAVQARGWESVTLTGDDSFLRAAALECARRGIGVENQEPDLRTLVEQESQRIEEERQRQAEQAAERERENERIRAMARKPDAPMSTEERRRFQQALDDQRRQRAAQHHSAQRPLGPAEQARQDSSSTDAGSKEAAQHDPVAAAFLEHAEKAAQRMPPEAFFKWVDTAAATLPPATRAQVAEMVQADQRLSRPVAEALRVVGTVDAVRAAQAGPAGQSSRAITAAVAALPPPLRDRLADTLATIADRLEEASDPKRGMARALAGAVDTTVQRLAVQQPKEPLAGQQQDRRQPRDVVDLAGRWFETERAVRRDRSIEAERAERAMRREFIEALRGLSDAERAKVERRLDERDLGLFHQATAEADQVRVRTWREQSDARRAALDLHQPQDPEQDPDVPSGPK